MKKILFVLALMASASFATVVNGGVKSGYYRVYGNNTMTFTERFYGGSDAGVAISGDGSTDLDLYVYDQNWNTICTSTTYGDDEYCTWNPIWTGPFRIEVVNRGIYANDFSIVAN